MRLWNSMQINKLETKKDIIIKNVCQENREKYLQEKDDERKAEHLTDIMKKHLSKF